MLSPGRDWRVRIRAQARVLGVSRRRSFIWRRAGYQADHWHSGPRSLARCCSGRLKAAVALRARLACSSARCVRVQRDDRRTSYCRSRARDAHENNWLPSWHHRTAPLALLSTLQWRNTCQAPLILVIFNYRWPGRAIAAWPASGHTASGGPDLPLSVAVDDVGTPLS